MQLTLSDMDEQVCELIPAREEMALFNIAVVVPVNVGAALNVLTEKSSATAFAGQLVGVSQR